MTILMVAYLSVMLVAVLVVAGCALALVLRKFHPHEFDDYIEEEVEKKTVLEEQRERHKEFMELANEIYEQIGIITEKVDFIDCRLKTIEFASEYNVPEDMRLSHAVYSVQRTVPLPLKPQKIGQPDK